MLNQGENRLHGITAVMLAAIPGPAAHHRPILGDFAGSDKTVAAHFG